MKRILISAAVFIGVFALMCLAAKFVIYTSAGVEDGVTDKAAMLAERQSKKERDPKKDSGDASKDKDSGKKESDAGTASEGEETVTGTAQPDPVQTADAGSAGSDEKADRQDNGSEDTQNLTADTDGDGNKVSTDDGNDTFSDDEKSEDGGDAPKPHVVCIDAAHQAKADISKEAVGPGSSDTKYKVTSGATGTTTGGPEYIINLGIALKLKELLLARGYEVVMIRENHDVNISDSERAKLANDSADIVIHIHCNADDTRDTMSGIMAFEPSEDNKYVDGGVRVECARLGASLLDKLAAATGAKNWGVIRNDNLTALNWTKIPASHVEVGYLTNPDEDRLLQTDDYQRLVAGALADGVDAFFEQ
ncbi:MAG: N-acetylmuramoyl-L-alanine amidase [Lachnospiraceae bacterium]|nr:N-acetylmuramoyl-L-alanine amidase [Lachnospiraceae bacterium]